MTSTSSSTSSNPLETMVKGLSSNGMTVDFQKRVKDGSYMHATEKDLSLLNSQATIASTAQELNPLSKNERLLKALELKTQGNLLYKNGDIHKALETYLQALTATDFGASGSDVEKESGNVDELVVPVLCNMAACCLQCQQYVKVVHFCDQILQLRPNHIKALLRRGIAFYHIQEYKLSIESLKHAHQLTRTTTTSTTTTTAAVDHALSDNDATTTAASSTHESVNHDDLDRITIYLQKARKGRAEELERLQKQKESLQRAFATGPYAVTPQLTTTTTTTTTTAYLYLVELMQHLLSKVISFLISFFLLCGQFLKRR